MKINFYHKLNKHFSKIIIDLNTELKLIKKTKLNYNFLVNELIFLSLKTEIILYDNSPKQKNPISLVKKDLVNLLEKVKSLKYFTEFDNNISFKKRKLNSDNNHKKLFNKLWTNFNLKDFKKERLGRYNKRLKINNLKPFIKNKNVADFGCGHGNFLFSCCYLGAKECDGIDYGFNSIQYAKKMSIILNLKNKTNFYCRSVYKSKLRSNYYDFAIQNGVFHHLRNEQKAYNEIFRILKKGGYCWVYTDGGGGLRDFVSDLIQNILNKVDTSSVINIVRSFGLTTNKEYHIGDGFNAIYSHTNLTIIKKKLSKIGFKFVRQLKGGCKTDSDKPFHSKKYFNEKFGSGDLRLLFKK